MDFGNVLASVSLVISVLLQNEPFYGVFEKNMIRQIAKMFRLFKSA